MANVLRIVDVVDPPIPREIGYFVSEAVAGWPSPHSNDVNVDDRRLIYFADRLVGFVILEPRRQLDVSTVCAAVGRVHSSGMPALSRPAK